MIILMVIKVFVEVLNQKFKNKMMKTSVSIQFVFSGCSVLVHFYILSALSNKDNINRLGF
jgi:hypothetical protein